MTLTDIINRLSKLTNHVTFTYNGYSCGIDPLSHNEFEIWYGEDERTLTSIDEVLNTKFFDGKSLTDIWNDITELDY